MIQRSYFQTIKNRLNEPRSFIQVLYGPRQVGKTTLIKQVLDEISAPFLFATADDIIGADGVWLRTTWNEARLKIKTAKYTDFVLVIDEIQKIENSASTPSENTIINLNELPQMSNLTPAVVGWERNGNPEEYTLDFLNKLNQNKKTEVNPKMIEWLNKFIKDNELDMKTDNLSQDNIKKLKEALAAQIAENEDDD